MPLDPGTKLGPDEVVALIGAGGTGEVYQDGKSYVLTYHRGAGDLYLIEGLK
jgi:hypothetical protein